MNVRYYYSIQSAEDAGEREHPQVVIRKTFPDAIDFEPRSVGDCWFFKAERMDTLPPYIIPCGEDGIPVWKWHTNAAPAVVV
jgi:hypothetical protein